MSSTEEQVLQIDEVIFVLALLTNKVFETAVFLNLFTAELTGNFTLRVLPKCCMRLETKKEMP